MRWVGIWAVAIVGTVSGASGCLTSQENPSDGGGVEDPPVTNGRGGSGGSSQGGDAGEDTGGSGGRGGTSGTSGTGNGEGGADGCSDDADCASRPDDRSRCSVPTGECVDCLTVADCEAGDECTNNVCRPITTCSTSSDCSRGVCNTATDRCVECVGSTGCATGERCVGNTCQKTCTTDSQCVLFGLRCNESSGYCVSCLSHDDCPETRNCQQGTCVRDICVAGSGSCDGNTLATCDAEGSRLNYPVPCGSQYTCTEDSSGARCEPWVCQPGMMGCSLTSERVVSCSADGLTETVVEDCGAMGQLCIGTTNGMCADAICEPSMRFCQGNTVQQCDSTGTSSYPFQTCTGGQLCNPQTTTCATPVCMPGQPACNGNVFTTCNSTGFGYTAGGTDCAAMSQFCSASGCTTSAVDTIPPMNPTLSSSSASNYLMANIFSVSGNRTLSRIEQYMSPASATTLTWQVYESTTRTGTYTNISTTTTTSTTGAGYQSSDTLAVPLVAGRFYAIGVSWTTAMIYGYQSASATQTVSFGALTGATFTSPPPPSTFTPSISTSAFVPQRLTTGP